MAQAELARKHAIGGFAYYHYWFNGKLLLERPLEEVLASGKPDFPFCLCWANESWTRAWDGLESQVLMRQSYESYDPAAHLAWLARAFLDPRHIRVRGAPLFLVYNASHLPRLHEVVNAWRRSARTHGIDDLYLCSVLSHRNTLTPQAALEAGFDASVEFLPHPALRCPRTPANFVRSVLPRLVNRTARLLAPRRPAPFPILTVHSYRQFARKSMQTPATGPRTFPCVFPGWDSSPRRSSATIIQNGNPRLYGEWLRHALWRAART